MLELNEEQNVRQQEVSKSYSSGSLYSIKSIRFALGVSILYLIISFLLVGFKMDQLMLVIIFNSLFFLHQNTRRFITGFSIFIIYWIVFDYMKAFPNYHYNHIHIGSLYNLEKQVFGIATGNSVITVNEYFRVHQNKLLDVLSGIFYLCWVPVPLIFAAILFFRNRLLYFQFALCFFLVNLIGFCGYYIYPAAPPWYVQLHGFNFIPNTPGNTAGLGRFDQLLGVGIFHGLYSKSSNVFAAMPSLHASYLLIVLYYGMKADMRWYNLLFAVIMLGIWFAAVYSSHHYLLDIVAGIFCAIIGIFLFEFFIRHTTMGKSFLNNLIKATN